MARSSLGLPSVAAVLLVVFFAVPLLHCNALSDIDAEAPGPHPAGGEGSLRPEECAAACDVRCSKAHAHNNCIFFCIKCCQKCLCVPSGTFSNKEECPCYNNWKTKEGGPKCP